MTKKEGDYIRHLQKFPETYSFLQERRIQNIKKLESRWRQQNLLLKVSCEEGVYVFKEISAKEEYVEIPRIQALKQEHPSLFPDIFSSEDNTYLMEFLKGPTFFELTTKQKISGMQKVGAKLNEAYSKENVLTLDVRDDILKSLEFYFNRAHKGGYFSLDEFPKVNIEIFKEVPDQLCHGDLNAANLIYGDSIKIIDPADKGFSDIARDIGIYCASCFFNHYDYFGNNKKESLEVAEVFLNNFNEETLQRVKYYIGQSFLSFINYQTETTPKGVLKKLSQNVLQKEGRVLSLLEESL